MRPLDYRESKRLRLLRAALPVEGVYAHVEDHGGRYARLAGQHLSRGEGGGWIGGRVLYINLSTGESFDRNPADFADRLTRLEGV